MESTINMLDNMVANAEAELSSFHNTEGILTNIYKRINNLENKLNEEQSKNKLLEKRLNIVEKQNEQYLIYINELQERSDLLKQGVEEIYNICNDTTKENIKIVKEEPKNDNYDEKIKELFDITNILFKRDEELWVRFYQLLLSKSLHGLGTFPSSKGYGIEFMKCSFHSNKNKGQYLPFISIQAPNINKKMYGDSEEYINNSVYNTDCPSRALDINNFTSEKRKNMSIKFDDLKDSVYIGDNDFIEWNIKDFSEKTLPVCNNVKREQTIVGKTKKNEKIYSIKYSKTNLSNNEVSIKGESMFQEETSDY